MSPLDDKGAVPKESTAPAPEGVADQQDPRHGNAEDTFQSRYDGSFSPDDPYRPRWVPGTRVVAEYDYLHADGRYACTKIKGERPDGEKAFLTGQRKIGNDLQIARMNWPEDFYKFDGLKHFMKGSGDEPDLLYRLPELVRDLAERTGDPVLLCEGEKDVDRLRGLGLIATTNPNGALNWKSEFNSWLAGRDVVVLTDNDDNGRQRGPMIRAVLSAIARSVRVVELPGLPENGDVSDWLDGGHTLDDLMAELRTSEARTGSGVNLEDFRAFMPAHTYIFAPSGESWPSTSVNSRIQPVPLFNRNGTPVLDDDGEQVRQAPNKWLDQHRPVEQMTWAPGQPQVIADRLIAEGGWIHRTGCNVFNLYRPPTPLKGDPEKAGPWIDHCNLIYPGEADHIINWLAHRVQRPAEKINHALVFGGAMGIGKDAILEPLKAAVGPWNFADVSPKHMLGRFNGFVKSVILRVSEARDLGDVDRFAFYDHMKSYTAAPPDVLRVDEKHRQEYAVFNVCGVIITTNHKTDGIYLPADDRRHFVAWTEMVKEDFTDEYWDKLWGWYARGGIGHVAAFLAQKDITAFSAKMPPPKTQAFWDIVASNSAPEEAELTDALERLGNPAAVTLSAIALVAEESFGSWLRDRRNYRSIPHKMEECGYKQVRNPSATSGRWKVDGKDAVIYARKDLSVRDAMIAAEKRAREGNNVPM